MSPCVAITWPQQWSTFCCFIFQISSTQPYFLPFLSLNIMQLMVYVSFEGVSCAFFITTEMFLDANYRKIVPLLEFDLKVFHIFNLLTPSSTAFCWALVFESNLTALVRSKYTVVVMVIVSFNILENILLKFKYLSTWHLAIKLFVWPLIIMKNFFP